MSAIKIIPIRGMIDESPTFKPGDMPPKGYLARQEWANVQIKARLKQERCCHCSLWKFPQELSGHYIRTMATTSRGLRKNIVSPVCKDCAAKDIPPPPPKTST